VCYSLCTGLVFRVVASVSGLFFIQLRFAEFGWRHGNDVQKSCLHDLHRLLGLLGDQ
jgi:hypothetical protein